MKKLKHYILLFCIAISIPLFYVAWRTYDSLANEERSKLRFFTESLFDEMENEMAALLEREEKRAVDVYHFSPSPRDEMADPQETYIVGYFQNNPDGSFQTPVVKDLQHIPTDYKDLVGKLRQINQAFNQRKRTIAKIPSPAPAVRKAAKEKSKIKTDFAEKYLVSDKQVSKRAYLGQKKVRVENITRQQAASLDQEDAKEMAAASKNRTSSKTMPLKAEKRRDQKGRPVERMAEQTRHQMVETPGTFDPASRGFLVEVAPFQVVLVDAVHAFVFRRVEIQNRIYRQGFVLGVEPFLRHLAAAHYNSQPIAGFTRLSFTLQNRGKTIERFTSGKAPVHANLVSQRIFPAPFDLFSAVIRADGVPVSPARRSLTVALAVFGVLMLLGLFAIYHSTRKILELAERRAGFVSSVTHELKTPLTNIRMYIEMLEQGMALDADKEQDYYKVLGSESARLSRLINNVLELSRLEKKQRYFRVKTGDFNEVLTEATGIMEEKLNREGFTLKIRQNIPLVFAYDREVMIQVLINLIDNSIKFGRHAAEKKITIGLEGEGDRVVIAVSDTGPGIPKKALKKVFDDFFRVDNDMTRTTGGTGIGLALVKKLVQGMGGVVKASNNKEAGCTVTLSFPLNQA